MMRSPRTSSIPNTCTLPGAALIEGPRAVRARPDTWEYAFR